MNIRALQPAYPQYACGGRDNAGKQNIEEVYDEVKTDGLSFVGRITSYNVCYTKLLRILALLLIVAQAGFGGDVRHKSFTPDELAAMKASQAVIHTKFGDITIRFFPEVAPNHVDNFIRNNFV